MAKRQKATLEKLILYWYILDMSFQAYLDNIEEKTGKTPQEFIEEAKAKGFGPETKAGEIVTWLKDAYGLGRGHAMALVYVIKNGPQIGDKYVNSGGVHNDPSDTLVLTGKVRLKMVINALLLQGHMLASLAQFETSIPVKQAL